MRKLLDSVEMFFARLVPGPLKRYYRLGFRYGIFVFGGLVGWLAVIITEQLLLKVGVWRGIGYALGIVLAIIFTFTYHRYVTFGLKTESKERFIKFAPLQVTLSAANWMLFIAATEYLGFPDVPASFAITFVLSLANFAGNKLFIFHK